MSWLLSNNRLEKVPVVSVPHTSSNRLLPRNQDKGCTPSVAHSLPPPLGPALLNLWTVIQCREVNNRLTGWAFVQVVNSNLPTYSKLLCSPSILTLAKIAHPVNYLARRKTKQNKNINKKQNKTTQHNTKQNKTKQNKQTNKTCTMIITNRQV